MTRSKHDDNGKETFFGAVTKNCKTVFVEENINAVRDKIAQRSVTGNNVAIFKCCLNGGKVNKKLTHKPSFKLVARHHVVFEDACRIFLEARMGA